MKKNIFPILIILFTVMNVHGQACGIYNVKIVGTLNSNKVEVKEIKIPKIRMLEYKRHSELDYSQDFTEFKIENNKINIETQAGLGSIYENAESLKKSFKEKNGNFLLLLVKYKNGLKTEMKIEIDWNKIDIVKVDGKGFGNYFEINLKEIDIDSE